MRDEIGSARIAFGVGALLVLVLNLTACSSELRHRVVVYDHSWSRAAAVRNLWCAPVLSKACAQQATEAEQDFSNKLPRAFREEPECHNVSFVAFSADDANAATLESELKTQGSVYWRLRVNFGPGLPRQPFSLGAGEETPRIEGDDAEHDSAFICTAVKNNGVIDIW
jgi:hypothetical protein